MNPFEAYVKTTRQDENMCDRKLTQNQRRHLSYPPLLFMDSKRSPLRLNFEVGWFSLYCSCQRCLGWHNNNSNKASLVMPGHYHYGRQDAVEDHHHIIRHDKDVHLLLGHYCSKESYQTGPNLVYNKHCRPIIIKRLIRMPGLCSKMLPLVHSTSWNSDPWQRLGRQKIQQ